MASPQAENGHVRVAHEIVTAIASREFTGREHAILWIILDQTYGYGRKVALISNGLLARATGIARPHCSSIVATLERKGVLLADRTDRKRVIGIQKDYDQWDIPIRSIVPSMVVVPSAVVVPPTETSSTADGTKTSTVDGTDVVPPTVQYKKTSNKQRKQGDKQGASAPFVIPDWIPSEAWNGYVEMRRSIRHPMTERAKELAINKLERWKKQGMSPAEILDQSVMNGWQGLFELKEGTGGTKYRQQDNSPNAKLARTIEAARRVDAGEISFHLADLPSGGVRRGGQ